MNKAIDIRTVNAEINAFKQLLKKESTFEEGKSNFLAFHKKLYCSEMGNSNTTTFEDLLWKDLTETIARTSTNEKGRTVLYGLWHASRIEDITMNMLVAKQEQIYNQYNFGTAINAGINHTGNSLSKDEILEMSSNINIYALKEYRLQVGRKTQEIVRSLQFADLKRKIEANDIEEIRIQGAVDDVPEANWLLDYWGNKTVAGILYMPASRHQIVHLQESFRAKETK